MDGEDRDGGEEEVEMVVRRRMGRRKEEEEERWRHCRTRGRTPVGIGTLDHFEANQADKV